MARGAIVRYDNDMTPGALSISATGEEDPYLITNAILDNPAKPWRSTLTSDRAISEYAVKKQPVLTSLIYHYLDAGLDVRLQANNTNTWGSPALDIPIVIPAKRKDGPSNQRWTVNPFALVDLPDPDGYFFWSWYFPTNSQVITTGKFILASAVDYVEFLTDGGDLGSEKEYDEKSAIRNETELGVHKRSRLGGPRRFRSGQLIASDDDAGTPGTIDAADLRAIAQAAEGDIHPWLFIEDLSKNDAMLVDVEDFSWERSHHVGGFQRWNIAVREVSRGLPFP